MDKKILGAGIAMMVLKLLEEEPMYGYQIIKTLEERKKEWKSYETAVNKIMEGGLCFG
ncbi:MAG TPA: helix-turn-helix transcriptional regulator [Candidatus Hungatella pullicola]|nr:helix-turn-helix transcriptional regulator [Candidatus Hungatella pullicola]